MIQTTEYSEGDLEKGKCTCCDEKGFVVIDDGRCPDCIEEQKFYEETMKQHGQIRKGKFYIDPKDFD